MTRGALQARASASTSGKIVSLLTPIAIRMLLPRLRSLHTTAWFGWLLLFVLARGMFAPGFMPAFGAAGVSIQMCSPQGQQALWSGGELAESHGSLDCPFGLSLGLAALPSHPSQLDVHRAQEAPQLPVSHAAASAVTAVYQARGPPSYS